MKSKYFSFLAFAALLLSAIVARAGITVYDPTGSHTGANFTIYYGLGSPAPGKIVYVSVTTPNGNHSTVAQAENVSDMSQVCYLYADQVGTYRFFYEYSFVSQGVARTVVSETDRYISAANNPPQTTGVSAGNTSPGVGTTINGTAYDQDGNMQYLYFYVNPPDLSGWQSVGSAYAPGTSVSGSVGWTPGSGVLRGTWTAHVRALDAAGVWDWNGNITSGFSVKSNQTVLVIYNPSITVNTPVTPNYYGGSGTGPWQFVIAGYTNWGGTQAGTLLPPSNTPSTTWTPTATGTYQYWIQKLGDNDYYNSNISGPYYLTVTPAGQSTVSISPVSSTITVGQSITFAAAGGSGSGGYIWGGDASGSGSGQTVTFNTPGSRTVTVYRQGDSNYNDSNTATATITVNAYALTVQSGTGSGSYTAGTGVTISANSPASGFAFGNWTLVSGPGSFANAGASSTTFTMGSGAATVQANYVDVQAPATPAGLSATSLTTTSFTLNWNATSDNVNVTAYEVRRDTTSLGTTSSLSMSITSLVAGTTYQMTVRARDAAGNWSGWSTALPVTTNAPPVITGQPASQTAPAGSAVSFSVVATGTPAPTYQWRKNGTNISGATNSTLSFASVQASDAGNYSVVVTNSVGPVTSSTATLTVTVSQYDTNDTQILLNTHIPY